MLFRSETLAALAARSEVVALDAEVSNSTYTEDFQKVAPERFIETYTAGSWEEHMRQHHSRLTESDRQHEARANACAVCPPRVEHFVQTTTRRL